MALVPSCTELVGWPISGMATDRTALKLDVFVKTHEKRKSEIANLVPSTSYS